MLHIDARNIGGLGVYGMSGKAEACRECIGSLGSHHRHAGVTRTEEWKELLPSSTLIKDSPVGTSVELRPEQAPKYKLLPVPHPIWSIQ